MAWVTVYLSIQWIQTLLSALRPPYGQPVIYQATPARCPFFWKDTHAGPTAAPETTCSCLKAPSKLGLFFSHRKVA